MKKGTLLLSVFHRQTLPEIKLFFGMILSSENKDDLKNPEKLVDLQSKFNELRSEEKIVEQGSRYDTNEVFLTNYTSSYRHS